MFSLSFWMINHIGIETQNLQEVAVMGNLGHGQKPNLTIWHE